MKGLIKTNHDNTGILIEEIIQVIDFDLTKHVLVFNVNHC